MERSLAGDAKIRVLGILMVAIENAWIRFFTTPYPLASGHEVLQKNILHFFLSLFFPWRINVFSLGEPGCRAVWPPRRNVSAHQKRKVKSRRLSIISINPEARQAVLSRLPSPPSSPTQRRCPCRVSPNVRRLVHFPGRGVKNTS